MLSFLYRCFRYATNRFIDLVNPRSIYWRFLIRTRPESPIITKLWGGQKVRIYPRDVIGKTIFVSGIFEKAEAMYVSKFLKPGMVFFDLGANLGQYTLLAATCVGIDGRVHSFEPSDRMFSELEYNVNLNDLSHICILNKVAVSNTAGQAKFSRYEPGAEVFGSLGAQQRDNKVIIDHDIVNTITLDAYVENKKINHIDLIKVDIEGAELLAMQGAKNILAKSDAPGILIEMADINTVGLGYFAVDIWDYLNNFGYTFYRINKRGRLCHLAQRPSDFSKAQGLLAVKDISKFQ